jgi:two-component system, cell cycle sensor histidine kinase and response regulator CckA
MTGGKIFEKSITDEKRNILGVENVGQDMAAPKHIEGALWKNEKTFRFLFDLSPQAIALTEIETGRLVNVNDTFCELTKYTKEEVVGLTTIGAGFYDEEDRIRFMKELQRSGEVNGLEMEFKAKDGSILNALMFSKVIRSAEMPFILTVFLNMTEQKQLKEQLEQAQKMESIGTLAGGIAHNFNNLLMGIQGRTSLMFLDTDFDHPHFEYLKEIECYIMSAKHLTRQLLDIDRNEKYEVKPTNMNEIIDHSSEMFGKTQKKVIIRKSYQSDIWTVEVDRPQIEQVLLNLYVNAWQAMSGSGKLYLQTQNVTLNEDDVKSHDVEPGKYVKISVADTGVGIDDGIRHKIFDPFFTTKEVNRGTGLGLASVSSIIKGHGGIINVHSKKGKGATFNIFLPASDKKLVKTEDFSLNALKGAETVLLIDDEDMILYVGRDLLEKLGYKVLTANSSKATIKIYKKFWKEIDIVIMDIVMPKTGGEELYDKLKKINPEIKVLLSSGYDFNGLAGKILSCGCNGFLRKPYNIKTLSQEIRKILDN